MRPGRRRVVGSVARLEGRVWKPRNLTPRSGLGGVLEERLCPRWVRGAVVRLSRLAESQGPHWGEGSWELRVWAKRCLQGFAVAVGGPRSRISLPTPACSRWLTRAAGASCLDWGSWAAPAPGWDCCWAPPRALDSFVPFTASDGNGPSAMSRASCCPTHWTSRRLQSPAARVGAGPLTNGRGNQAAFSRTCGTGQGTRVPESLSPF